MKMTSETHGMFKALKELPVESDTPLRGPMSKVAKMFCTLRACDDGDPACFATRTRNFRANSPLSIAELGPDLRLPSMCTSGT